LPAFFVDGFAADLEWNLSVFARVYKAGRCNRSTCSQRYQRRHTQLKRTQGDTAMRELPPIYRFFPADQFSNVDRPGIMISASNDENAASVAKNLLHLIGGSGELWADNQMIRLFHSPEPDEVMEQVWSDSKHVWRAVELSA
jgi:hypothetical protein